MMIPQQVSLYIHFCIMLSCVYLLDIKCIFKSVKYLFSICLILEYEFQANLTAAERAFIHTTARTMGMKSKSHG